MDHADCRVTSGDDLTGQLGRRNGKRPELGIRQGRRRQIRLQTDVDDRPQLVAHTPEDDRRRNAARDVHLVVERQRRCAVPDERRKLRLGKRLRRQRAL